MQPSKPALIILSEPMFISALLMKPTTTDNRTIEALQNGHDNQKKQEALHVV
jgi:hypothetical protein